MAYRPKLIAELGNIHLHDVDNCKRAVSDAFSAGADLVKVQCINPLTAYWASKKQLDRYKSFEWTMTQWCDFLSEMNHLHKNRVFVSTFDDLYVERFKDLVSYWKVAFKMRDNLPMVAKMIWTEKPIFFSTRGRMYNEDHDRYFTRSEMFIPLFTTEYQPSPVLQRKIVACFAVGRYGGISVNFGGKEALSLCRYMAPQCRYIEVHVKGQGADGPDAEWSLTMTEMEKLRLETEVRT